MRTRRVDVVVRDIVLLALASTACGTSQQGGLGEDMTPACADPNTPGSVVTGLTPGVAVDYLGTRSESLTWTTRVDADGGAEANDETWRATDQALQGTPCATANDRAGCEAKLASLRIAFRDACPSSGEGFDFSLSEGPAATASGAGRRQPGCFPSYLVYTRGDEVGIARTRAEVVSLLAPIDTKEEAFYLATREGFAMNCYEDPKAKWSVAPGGGFDVLVETQSGCTRSPQSVEQVIVRIASDGTRTVVARKEVRQTQGGCVEGRRPAGLVSGVDGDGCDRDLGAYFARSAHLEAASVVAFERLATELTALGAPRALLRRIARARREEIAHARVTTRLARRFGGAAPPVRITPHRKRTPLAIALENVREGCVRETLGAAIALHRAERATDPEVARAYRAIAEDELRHARLSWDLAAWLDTKLTPAQRARVRRAMAREVDATLGELGEEPSATLARVAGVPSAEITRALFADLALHVWSPALAA